MSTLTVRCWICSSQNNMSSDKEKERLISSTRSFVNKKNNHCLLLTLNNDRTGVDIRGDGLWVETFSQNPQLLQNLTRNLLEQANTNEERVLNFTTFPTHLTKLFARPNSKKWKGVAIRAQLTKYLNSFGFGKNKRRYGIGMPPPGWPVLVDWLTFKGPSLNVSLQTCTEIILQLLEYQGYNPMEHVNDDSTSEEEELSGVEKVNEVEEEEEENEQNEQDAKRRRCLQSDVDRVADVISKRQEHEEQNNPVFERRRKNMEEIKEGLRLLEEGELSD